MILPSTYISALLLIILSMICWGSWANTMKLTGKWRFELFYFDYSLGVLLVAILAAFTFGSMGVELSVMDNLMITGKRQIAYAFAGGVVFNLANMLLVAAIAVAGLAVAFPVGIGLAMVIGVVWNYILNPQGNPAMLFTGSGLVIAAIIVDSLAYTAHAKLKAKSEEPAPKVVMTRGRQQTKPKGTALKGIVLSLVAGLLMGSFYPLVEMSKASEVGLQPYSVGLIFGVAIFLSTFVFNLFFMNMPVQGEPVYFGQYFKGTASQHLLGILGGAIWCTGTVSNFVAASAPASVNVGPAVSYALGQGATAISALWGLLVWKEFAGAEAKTRVLITVMMVLFLAGLVTISLAPKF
jgi:glucose uptake protein